MKREVEPALQKFGPYLSCPMCRRVNPLVTAADGRELICKCIGFAGRSEPGCGHSFRRLRPGIHDKPLVAEDGKVPCR